MRGASFRKREGLVDAYVELAFFDPGEEIVGAAKQFRARGDIRAHRGAGEIKRAFLVENLRVDRLNLAASLAVQNHVAARAQTVETFIEGVFAH